MKLNENPLWAVSGLSIWCLAPDWMHTVDGGIGKHFAGSVPLQTPSTPAPPNPLPSPLPAMSVAPRGLPLPPPPALGPHGMVGRGVAPPPSPTLHPLLTHPLPTCAQTPHPSSLAMLPGAVYATMPLPAPGQPVRSH